MPDSRPKITQRGWWLISGIGIAVMVVLAAWWGVSASRGVSYSQAGYQDIKDNSITAIWDVVTPEKKAVTCTIIAMDDQRNVLGTRVLQLKPSKHESTRYTETIKTTSRAVTATVKECHYQGERPPAN